GGFSRSEDRSCGVARDPLDRSETGALSDGVPPIRLDREVRGEWRGRERLRMWCHQVAARNRASRADGHRPGCAAWRSTRVDGLPPGFWPSPSSWQATIATAYSTSSDWEGCSGRRGFLDLALAHGAEVLFVAAVGNEEMYYQSRLPTPGPVVSLADAGDGMRYRGAPLRFGLLGPHLLPGVFPLPVQLTHVVSPRLPLGNRALALRDPAVFERLHRTVWRRCQTFLARAVARRDRSADLPDRTIRAGERL